MFFKKYTLILLTLPLFLLLQSCSESPSGIGADLLEQDQISVRRLDTSDDSVTVTSSSFKRKINLGASTRILVGKTSNLESGILVKFDIGFADTLARQIRNDSIQVVSSWITMVRNYRFGNESDPLELEVFNITSGWTTSGFTSDSLPSLQYDNVNQNAGSVLGDTTVINLQPQMVAAWVDASADTSVPDDNGAYLKPTANSNKVHGYHAIGSEAGLIPRLSIVISKMDGDLDTLIYSAYADLGVVTGEIPSLGDDKIIVQGGIEIASRVMFDISRIPNNAIINKAEIVFTPDTLLSRHGDNYTNSLVASFIIDTLSYDSLQNSVLIGSSNGLYRGDITFFVQEWVRKNNNSGLLITAAGRINSVELFALYGSQAPAALRPKLIITYTIKQ